MLISAAPTLEVLTSVLTTQDQFGMTYPHGSARAIKIDLPFYLLRVRADMETHSVAE